MLTAHEYRERAAQSLREAEATADPNASTTLRWLAKEWTALALQIERGASRQSLDPPPVKRPADLARRDSRSTDVIDAADILRQRLRLTD